MNTAEDYRTAAKVAESSCDPDVAIMAEAWNAEADRLEERDQYLARLGAVALDSRGGSFIFIGTRIVSKLIEDGWTSPEGLL